MSHKGISEGAVNNLLDKTKGPFDHKNMNLLDWVLHSFHQIGIQICLIKFDKL